MDIETIGGCCPNCNNIILIKLVPHSLGSFQFDACPTCGFIEFETNDIRSQDDTTTESRIETWIAILEHTRCTNLSDLKKQQIDNNTADPVYGNECVFNYSNATTEYLKSCIITQEMIDNHLCNN